MSSAATSFRLAYPDIPNPPYTRVSVGTDFAEAVSTWLAMHNLSRAYIIVSPTLSRKTPHYKKLQQVLGDRLVGTWFGIPAHTPVDSLIPIINDIREKKADIIITLGGGSLSDGAKLISYSLAYGVTNMDDFRGMASKGVEWWKGAAAYALPDVEAPILPKIFIPISLSGGEFSKWSGVTDPVTHLKSQYKHPKMYADLIVFDPVVAMDTPNSLWLSTGVRSIDHCVEGICSINAKAEITPTLIKALRLLVSSLLVTKKDPNNLAARASSQEGCNFSMSQLNAEIDVGASHGIGHMLGPMGVGHGETSCILLPAVMKYNARANGAQQETVKQALWSHEEIAPVLRNAGLAPETSDAGDALKAIFTALEMPTSLKTVNFDMSKIDLLAEHSLLDSFCGTNPIPLTQKQQVLDILATCSE